MRAAPAPPSCSRKSLEAADPTGFVPILPRNLLRAVDPTGKPRVCGKSHPAHPPPAFEQGGAGGSGVVWGTLEGSVPAAPEDS